VDEHSSVRRSWVVHQVATCCYTPQGSHASRCRGKASCSFHCRLAIWPKSS